jgi:hypothetical protein
MMKLLDQFAKDEFNCSRTAEHSREKHAKNTRILQWAALEIIRLRTAIGGIKGCTDKTSQAYKTADTIENESRLAEMTANTIEGPMFR